MADFGKLISGFRIFKATLYQQRKDVITHVMQLGTQPTTMFITCADLKIAPDILFSSNPGDSFVFRNLGGFIPPYDENSNGATLAAIDYAACTLNVENIIVLGHTSCDVIKIVMAPEDPSQTEEQRAELKAMRGWLDIVNDARDSVKKALSKKTQKEQEHACEHEAILVSMRNLISYPFIKTRIADGRLKIYGWYFDIEQGTLYGFDPKTRFFDPIG
jgi:carbonic anhydrase